MTSGNPQEYFAAAKSGIERDVVAAVGQLLDRHPAPCAARNDDSMPPTIGDSVRPYTTRRPRG